MLRKAVQVSGARCGHCDGMNPLVTNPRGHLRGQFTHLGDDEGVEGHDRHVPAIALQFHRDGAFEIGIGLPQSAGLIL